MLKNIGYKIQTIAKIYFIISVIYVIIAIISNLDDIPYIIIEYAMFIIKNVAVSAVLYGFGGIVEDISVMRQIYQQKSFNELNGFNKNDD